MHSICIQPKNNVVQDLNDAVYSARTWARYYACGMLCVSGPAYMRYAL